MMAPLNFSKRSLERTESAETVGTTAEAGDPGGEIITEVAATTVIGEKAIAMIAAITVGVEVSSATTAATTARVAEINAGMAMRIAIIPAASLRSGKPRKSGEARVPSMVEASIQNLVQAKAAMNLQNVQTKTRMAKPNLVLGRKSPTLKNRQKKTNHDT